MDEETCPMDEEKAFMDESFLMLSHPWIRY